MKTSEPQLDLFTDSRDVMLRNDVLFALERRDAIAARAAWRVLQAALPADTGLAPLDRLTRALEAFSVAPFADHAALARACDLVAGDLTDAARQALGPAAGADWLLPQWQNLALRSAGLGFDANRPEGHAAALWLRAEHWAEAEAAVLRIESWRRIPMPLGWMLEARCRHGQLDDSWPLLAELAWLAPRRLHALLPRLGDPLLARLVKRFGAGFDAGTNAGTDAGMNAAIEAAADIAWFPAWVLIDTPALAPHLASAWAAQRAPAEQAMRLMVELLGLEQAGSHAALIQRRRVLRDLHGPLYAAYMATR